MPNLNPRPSRIAPPPVALVALAIVVGALCSGLGNPAFAQATGARDDAATDRIIVKLRRDYRVATPHGARVLAMRSERTEALSATAGVALRAVRPMSDDAQVLALPNALREDTVQGIVDRLRRDPTVEYAHVDSREHLMAVPNDPSFAQQSHLQAPGAPPLVPAVDAPAAWDVTRGTATAVIAIVDGGVRFDHPDLSSRLLPGYDFVSVDDCGGQTGCTTATGFTTANDGDAREADASDPGDWVTSTEAATNPVLRGCTAQSSSWHGTHIAGIIGAAGDNGIGVAGLDWNATLLPVRVSGKCGGYRSDVVDGMRWAVGLAVPNVPANPRPAKIVNVSLGSAGTCASTIYGQAVIDILATGAIIVAAAGNGDAGLILPANCPGVISVGAVRGDGTRAIYSNSGPGLTVMAPGGDFRSATNDRLLSTDNAGTTVPQPYSSAGYYASAAGTSFSTPVVTGIVSLMLSINPALTSAQVADVLRTTARPFVAVAGLATCVAGGTGDANNTTPCNCTTAACGAGYVHAGAAVARAAALAVAAPATSRTPTMTTAPAAPPAAHSGSRGGGGIDITARAVLAVIGLATRRLRARGTSRGLRRPRRPPVRPPLPSDGPR